MRDAFECEMRVWEITRCALMRAPLFNQVCVEWINQTYLQTDDSSARPGWAAARIWCMRPRYKIKRGTHQQSGREEKIEIGKPKHSLRLARRPCVYFCSVWLEKSRHRIWHQLPRGHPLAHISYLPTGWCNIHDAVHCGERGCCCVHTLSFILITTRCEKAHSLASPCPNAAIFALSPFVVIFVGPEAIAFLNWAAECARG